MSGKPSRVIPLRAAKAVGNCSTAGPLPFSLMVLGDSMAPKLFGSDVVMIEPVGRASDGLSVRRTA